MDKFAAHDRWLAEANEVLRGLAGLEACWWSYRVSHLTFQLVVNPSSGPNFGAMLFWCRRAAGPTRWKPQHLSVGRFPVDEEVSSGLPDSRFFIEDLQAGFRAEADSLGWNAHFDVANPKEWRLWRPAELR